MEHGNIFLLMLILVVSFILAFVGSSVGLVLGHMRLPLLIAYLGSAPAGAIMNLIVSGFGALGGTIGHARNGRISWPALALMGIPSSLGAILAVWIVIQIHPVWSYLAIGIILIVSGVNMVRKKAKNPPLDAISKTRLYILEIVIGLLLGVLAAMTGLMLGSLRLPMMLKYLRMDPKDAVGTNMAVGCLTAAVGGTAGLITGTGRLDWLVLSVLLPATFAGGYTGGWIAGRLSKELVQKLAGWIISFTGVILLGQAGQLLWRKPPTPIPPLLIQESEYEWWDDLDFPTTDDHVMSGPSSEPKPEELIDP